MKNKTDIKTFIEWCEFYNIKTIQATSEELKITSVKDMYNKFLSYQKK